MQFEVLPLFSCPVAIFTSNMNYDHILEDNHDLWRMNESDMCKDNYISESTHVLKNYPQQFSELLSFSKHYVNSIMGNTEVGLNITTSWLTKTLTGGYSRNHAHYNSMLSGVYYFDGSGSEEDGSLVISSPVKPTNFYLGHPTELTLFNSPEWKIYPEKGKIVIFPSYLQHRISVHSQKNPRHSLAFNIYPTGEIGSVDSMVNIHKVA